MLLGITGGSGFYKLQDLKITKTETISTPFGKPSSDLIFGEINNFPIVFLARHGSNHSIPPHKINYRANIWALKKAGVTHLVAMSAVGSLTNEAAPGDFVVVNQFIDFTKSRNLTFYDDFAAHVSLAEPVCTELAENVAEAVTKTGAKVHKGGTYICIEGPQFSTKAESFWYKSIGGTVIGMTNATEARLAREAEIHFSTVAMVTDYDCWHENEDNVTVEAVIEVLKQNGHKANLSVKYLIEILGSQKSKCNVCSNALNNAVMSDFKSFNEDTKKKYEPLLGHYYQ